jgi:hypothetical protein
MPMLTRWVTNGVFAFVAFVPIKASAHFGSHAQTVSTFFTNTFLADWTLPTWLTLAYIRSHTLSIHTIGPADSLFAVYSSPAQITLATLTVIVVVVKETTSKMV